MIESKIVRLRTNDYYTCRSIAANPFTPKEVLIKLSKNKDSGIVYKISQNPNTPIEVLVELSKNENYFILCGVAENPNTPIDILIELSKNKNSNIREIVIKARINRIGLLK